MKQYVVDAFTDEVFHGNPAAVCLPDRWPSDELMLSVALENNLSETAFAVKDGERWHLRWFTPGGESDLCGHATLACAFVLMRYYEPDAARIVFSTMSGELTVTKRGELYEMAFPAYTLSSVPVTDAMTEALGARPVEAYRGRDLLCVFAEESVIRAMRPDLEKVKALDGLLLHVTAPGTETDCVSRSFAPKLNVPEDPVCGSGHCHIAPYWAGRFGKNEVVAFQASTRGGTLYCSVDGERVFLSGRAVMFSEGEIMLP